MDTHRIIHLYEKWKEETLTPIEQQELSLLFQDEQAEQILKEHWNQNWEMEGFNQDKVSIENYENIYQQIIQQPQHRRKNNTWKWLAAACLLIGVGISSVFYLNSTQPIPVNQLTTTNDIAPGGNRAKLTLSDGSNVDLNDDQEGIIIGEQNIKYNDGSDLFVFQSDSEGSLLARKENTPEKLLTLTTPKGGQYQITLPDGTKVWLNAASTLRYPTRFIGAERRVELSGEAYFEVTSVHQLASRSPFIVATQKQEVKVLGTHFNISAFPEESETRTTLVEGLVEVRPIAEDTDRMFSSLQILPNEQAVLSPDQFRKQKVNVEQFIAWKKGYFLFDDESINRVMQAIAKWYDVEVEFKGKASQERFNGMISRNRPISEVLSLLEETGSVQFKIKDNTVFVYP